MAAMNRREFLASSLASVLYLPFISVNATPVEPNPMKGAVIIRSANDVTRLRAGWWYNYTPNKNYDANGFVPMLRDPYQLADFRDSGWSTDVLPNGSYVLFYNEPNLVEQMYGLTLTPAYVAADLHELHEARPDLRIIGPSLYHYLDYYWTHADFIDAYHQLYGTWLPIVAIALHSMEAKAYRIINKLNLQLDMYDSRGYNSLPVWVTEYTKGNWTEYPNPETAAYIAGEVFDYCASEPRFARVCWFPARWEPDWTDPGGVGWYNQRLIESDTNLTEVGRVYAAR